MNIATHWLDPNDRPKDGQLVVYHFEPFNKLFIGVYDAQSDSVVSAQGCGFTSWLPEVLRWYPLPDVCWESNKTTALHDSEQAKMDAKPYVKGRH